MKWCGILALLAALLFTVAGCEDATNITTEAPGNGHNGRVIGMVHGIITAQGTNAPVEAVRITYAVNGDSRTTQSDANGGYRIDGLDEGHYTLCFFPADTTYAAWQEVVSVAYDSALTHPTDRDFHITISRNVMLYRCTASVTGYVFARADEEHTIPAAGAIVEVSGMGGVLNANYRAVCDSTGHYWLTGLPSVGTCMVVALPWSSGGLFYGSGSQTVVLMPDGLYGAANMTVLPVTTPVAVLNNNFLGGDFPVSDNLALVFNRPLKDSTLRVEMYSTTGFIPALFDLDDAGITLTIDPAVQLRPSASYQVAVYGRTLDNLPFSYGPVTFTTERHLELVSTNLWQVDGAIRQDVGLNEALVFTFSRDINIDDPHNVARVLRNGLDILVDWSWSADRLQLTITPAGSYMPSTLYTAYFVACSPIYQDQVSQTIDFWTVANQVPPVQVTGVALDDTAHYNWTTTSLWLSWDTQPDAEVYHVYGWDELHATDYINLGAFPASTFGRQRVMVFLPSVFDWLDNDGMQTPFAAGNRVHLAVRALNTTAAAPLSADVVAVDNVAPRGYALSQAGSVNNTTGAADVEVTMRFSSNIEYCTDAPPRWGFVEAGGDPTWVIPHDAAQWSWDGNHCNGSFLVIIPAHENGAGDRLWMTGISDNSGNMQADTVFRTLY